MRILHIGSGFRPWRRGGLIAYVEDLMHRQRRLGHEVSYFFSGRHFPFVSGPRLKRSDGGGVGMLEVVNSPLYDHGGQPDLELCEPAIERMLAGVIRELQPEVVHVQELAGLPSSVLDVARAGNVPTVVTLQDYFPLCSTFKLLDANGQVCLRREMGEDCLASTAAQSRDPAFLFEATLRFHLVRLPLLRSSSPEWRDPLVKWIGRSIASRTPQVAHRNAPRQRAADFQRRRDVNVSRLNRADRVIAMSDRVAEIYQLLGVDAGRLRTMQLTLAHIERLRPRRATTGTPITFATLGGLESTAKGADTLLAALRSLGATVAPGTFRMLVFGWPARGAADEAARLPGVELRGPYGPDDLDELLEEVDVGIVPSVWEEAYGYAGIEFLAKGIPVIGNDIGAIPEYTRDGETGWLNRSRSGKELAQIMSDIIENPEQVVSLNANLRAAHAEIVKPLDRHVEEMDDVYAQVLDSWQAGSR